MNKFAEKCLNGHLQLKRGKKGYFLVAAIIRNVITLDRYKNQTLGEILKVLLAELP